MENSMPLVSVVVPCYNHEYYVEKTIESIINQTYKNIELIVIDDGSKDNSVKVIQELADKYDFTFIHRPNKGLSATLNEGIKLSKGKYFCVCASDDYYALDKIEKQVAFMEENNEFGMCYGKVIEFNNESLKKRNKTNYKTGMIFDNLFLQDFSCPAVTVMVKQKVFKDIGFFDENLAIEDWDMWLRIAYSYKIGFLDEYIAYYRLHDNNFHKQSDKIYENQKKILSKWINNKLYNEAIMKVNESYFVSLSIYNKIKAIKFLIMNFFQIKKSFLFVKGLIKLIIPTKR